MHLFDGLKELELLLEKLTVPVGDVGVGEVSITVAVQEVVWLVTTLDGLQLTLVLVDTRVSGPEITAT